MMAERKNLRPQVKTVSVRHISTGSPFEEQIGYSRAVVADGWVFVAGTTGYDYARMVMPATIEEQCENTLATIARALEEAGSGLDHVVRVTYIVPDKAEWPKCWPITSRAFARARPAATMISADLQSPEMKIEIEVTARVPA
jgi:enamine deaminase RidA (YjgF/YER057c/UK114 family)